jgi:hypothetical protein
MKCEEIRERMPEVAAGFDQLTGDESNHLAGCKTCAEQWNSMKTTMALLDEWQVPEPSPYFDVRLQARLREEMTKPEAGWLHWFRRPALAATLTVVMGLGVGVLFTRSSLRGPQPNIAEAGTPPGSAVSDLQTLEKNHDMYSDFELLDDLDVQQDVAANP